VEITAEESLLDGAWVHVYDIIPVTISVYFDRPVPLTESGVFSPMEIQFVCTPILAFGNNSCPCLCSVDLWILKTEDAWVCGRGPVFDDKGPIKVLSIGTAQEIIELVRLGIS